MSPPSATTDAPKKEVRNVVASSRSGTVIVRSWTPRMVAEEHVMRGAQWLEQRWQDGGPKLKHMAIALRAEGLTQAQFHDLWRSRAGKVGTTPIPEDAKGLAYVQNHPLPRPDGDWAYDA